MKFNSGFFFCVLLCLILVSLSCSESKNAQLDKKFFDFGVQMAEKDARKECSEKNLSEADCNKSREDNLKEAREVMQNFITEFDETCKKSVLLEDECVEKKQQTLKEMLADSKRL
jgi:hypothetical protein